MKRVLANFVRKVLAIHPEDDVTNEEIAFTIATLFFIGLCLIGMIQTMF